jgi:hypothetical protein
MTKASVLSGAEAFLQCRFFSAAGQEWQHLHDKADVETLRLALP